MRCFSVCHQANIDIIELIDPSQISKVFLSPRQRAKSTYELLFGEHKVTGEVVETNDAREWTYGDYEGLKVSITGNSSIIT